MDSLRKGKNDPEGNSEIIRALTPNTGPGSKAVSSLVSKGRARWWSHSSELCVWGGGGADVATAVDLEGRVSNQRGLFLSLKTYWNLPL